MRDDVGVDLIERSLRLTISGLGLRGTGIGGNLALFGIL
jgi:hypothetical protein